MASKVRDVLIVGGGVMGCSTAYHLAMKAAGSLRISVVERSFGYKRASAVLSAGGIRMQFSEKQNIQMSQYGLDFIRSAKDNLTVPGLDPVDVNFVENGYLFLATEKGRAILENNNVVQKSVGAPVDILSPDQLKKRFPWLSTDDIIAGAFGAKDEGWFDPWAYLTGLKRKCADLGVEFIEGELAGNMQVNNRSVDNVDIATTDGNIVSIAPGHVVNASGAWAHPVAMAAGIHDLPVRARKRTVFVFQCPEAANWTGDACSPLVVDPSGVYFRPEGCSGQFICGYSPSEENDPDCEEHDPFHPDYELFDEFIWPTIAERVPAFEAIKMVNAWAGFYDFNTFDHNAIIGKHPDRDNFYCINGFSGHGLQQSPAAGRAIAELIHDGAYTTLDLSCFGFDRIRNNKPYFEKNIPKFSSDLMATQRDRKYDVYGDGTPCEGLETNLESLSSEYLASANSTLAQRSQQRRKINFNPSEGQVHARERNCPWRTAVNNKIALANQRAQEEQWEKRRIGLAKQVHEGLMHNYNIYVGISEVGNIIKVGQEQRRQENLGQVVENKDIAASAILVAAEKYDLARIAVLLDKVPKKLYLWPCNEVMGAAATVARKYQLDQHAARGYEFTLMKYHAFIQEAQRRGLNKEELQHLLELLRQKHLAMLAQLHRHTDPVLEALKPYYDKYQPVVKFYAVKSYNHAKAAYDRVDHAVTTATLQAIYQARRQLVAQLSDATIASYFSVAVADVFHIKVSKRTFSIQNAGCDLRHYEVEHSFLIEDKQFIQKLLELQWVPWQPTTTIAVKLIETFVLQIEYYSRNEFAIRIPAKLTLRVGPKWVALDTRESNHQDRPKWLQRIDFKEREKRSTLFYDLINNAYDRMREDWQKKQTELAALAAAEAAAKALEEATQLKNKRQTLSVLTPEMVRRTLAMFSQKIMDEERYQFYTLHSFENWRMELEDTLLNGTQTITELCELEAMIQEDELLRLYARRVIEGAERVRMETEDINQAITKEELAAVDMQKFDVDIESDWSDDENSDDL